MRGFHSALEMKRFAIPRTVTDSAAADADSANEAPKRLKVDTSATSSGTSPHDLYVRAQVDSGEATNEAGDSDAAGVERLHAAMIHTNNGGAVDAAHVSADDVEGWEAVVSLPTFRLTLNATTEDICAVGGVVLTVRTLVFDPTCGFHSATSCVDLHGTTADTTADTPSDYAARIASDGARAVLEAMVLHARDVDVMSALTNALGTISMESSPAGAMVATERMALLRKLVWCTTTFKADEMRAMHHLAALIAVADSSAEARCESSRAGAAKAAAEVATKHVHSLPVLKAVNRLQLLTLFNGGLCESLDSTVVDADAAYALDTLLTALHANGASLEFAQHGCIVLEQMAERSCLGQEAAARGAEAIIRTIDQHYDSIVVAKFGCMALGHMAAAMRDELEAHKAAAAVLTTTGRHKSRDSTFIACCTALRQIIAAAPTVVSHGDALAALSVVSHNNQRTREGALRLEQSELQPKMRTSEIARAAKLCVTSPAISLVQRAAALGIASEVQPHYVAQPREYDARNIVALYVIGKGDSAPSFVLKNSCTTSDAAMTVVEVPANAVCPDHHGKRSHLHVLVAAKTRINDLKGCKSIVSMTGISGSMKAWGPKDGNIAIARQHKLVADWMGIVGTAAAETATLRVDGLALGVDATAAPPTTWPAAAESSVVAVANGIPAIVTSSGARAPSRFIRALRIAETYMRASAGDALADFLLDVTRSAACLYKSAVNAHVVCVVAYVPRECSHGTLDVIAHACRRVGIEWHVKSTFAEADACVRANRFAYALRVRPPLVKDIRPLLSLPSSAHVADVSLKELQDAMVSILGGPHPDAIRGDVAASTEAFLELNCTTQQTARKLYGADATISAAFVYRAFTRTNSAVNAQKVFGGALTTLLGKACRIHHKDGNYYMRSAVSPRMPSESTDLFLRAVQGAEESRNVDVWHA